MYLPPAFEESRQEVLHALVRAHPLGSWVALAGSELVANPLPWLLQVDEGGQATLCGHVARANPVFSTAAESLPSVVTFQGPQTYISPGWYPSKQAGGMVVPTWNYVVVHVHGPARFISDRAWLMRHVTAMTDLHESRRAEPWRVSDAPPAFIERMADAIVGVEIRIERMEGKWKTSQNRSAADRRGAVEGLLQAGDAASIEMAELITRRETLS